MNGLKKSITLFSLDGRVRFTNIDSSEQRKNIVVKLPLTQAPVIGSHVPPEQ